VIAGTAPTTIQEKRSLDLFRHSSRDVVVVTFDELLDKLREILRLMTAGVPGPAPTPAPPADNNDLFDADSQVGEAPPDDEPKRVSPNHKGVGFHRCLK
jgi:hypothetical protein